MGRHTHDRQVKQSFLGSAGVEGSIASGCVPGQGAAGSPEGSIRFHEEALENEQARQGSPRRGMFSRPPCRRGGGGSLGRRSWSSRQG